MNPNDLAVNNQYIYAPVVPSKHFCNLEQKPKISILTYLYESPHAPGYHLFHDERGKSYIYSLHDYVVREQVKPVY